jgi:Tfp pilus assembly protein PilX
MTATSMRRQRGTTLVVALIMLVLLTLFAVTSLNTAKTSSPRRWSVPTPRPRRSPPAWR